MVIFDPLKKISLDSPYFTEMREKLDATIRSTFSAMDQKDMAKATVTLKISIEMEKQVIKDENSMTGEREVTVPRMEYKTASEMKAKGELAGKIVSGFNKELVRGDDGAYYIVDTEEASGQLNMFNSYDELDDDLPDEDDEDPSEEDDDED